MAKARRFELVAGTSNKFWEIASAGATVRVRFGRIGGAAREREETFASAKAAAEGVAKAVREKLGKGYREVGARATATKTAAKKTAVKRTAAKKTAVKKTAAKKTAVKKTAVKKATAKKTAVKQTAAKKTAVKTTAAKVATASMSAAQARELVARLEAALRKRYPAALARLNKGASEAAIARLQKLAGDRLPASFYELLRWRDGSAGSAGVLDGLVWLSASRTVSHKAMMDEIVEEGHYAAYAADEWWSQGWFPFADDESGYRSLVVDTHGSFGGQPGQVLRAAAKDSFRHILAPSFDAWLETYVVCAEKGQLDAESDGELCIDDDGMRRFAKRRGYPRICEPRPMSVAGESSSAGLRRPTRGAWPAKVPETARWLISAKGDRVQHWLVDQRGATITTWSGVDPTALRSSAKKAKDTHTARVELDGALRKQLAAGYVYGVAGAVARGEPICALHVGDGSSAENIDLAPDGRTLVVGTVLSEARGARIHLVDVETGRRATIHEFSPEGIVQTFIHRVAFGPDGAQIYVQMNERLYALPTTGGEPKLLAEMAGGPFNPHVTRFELDRARARLLYVHKREIRVGTTAGEVLLKIPLPRGVCEYREIGMSPSGRLIALLYRSRGQIYDHADALHDETSEVQIWSVDEGKRVHTLPFTGDMIRRIGLSADDRQLLIGDYGKLAAHDLRSGEQAWTREALVWAYAPDGSRVAFARHQHAVAIASAATRRPLFAVHEALPWASGGENHDPETLVYSDDGGRICLGNRGGRVYVWSVG